MGKIILTKYATELVNSVCYFQESTNARAVSVGAILSDYQRVRVEHV